MAIKPKFEIIDVNNIEVMADVSLLSKSDELFFNASLIAKQFGKLPADFLRLNSTQEYIEEILNDSRYGNSHNENLVSVKQGGKYQGTWLHQELAYEFAGWLSPLFRRNLHKWVESRINEEHERQQNRLKLKTGFLPLTNAIQGAHKELKPHHFIIECNLINRLVTGLSAKQFKQRYGVDNVRDALTIEQSIVMDKLQALLTSLIDLGFSYDERKERLTKYVEKFQLGCEGVI